MIFKVDDYMTYSDIKLFSNYDENELKNRTRYYLSRRCRDKLFVVLFDFFWFYAKKKGVNPIIPILECAAETCFLNFEQDDASILLTRDYKNTAGIKVTGEITDIFDRENNELPHSDTAPYLHIKFNSWVDSIRAQIDHLALFMGIDMCHELSLSHLSFDRRHTKSIRYDQKDDFFDENNQVNIAPTPSVDWLFGKYGSYSSTHYGVRLAARATLLMGTHEEALRVQDDLEWNEFHTCCVDIEAMNGYSSNNTYSIGYLTPDLQSIKNEVDNAVLEETNNISGETNIYEINQLIDRIKQLRNSA